ncbi:MAG: DUF2520 domain-containing protein [Flavobacteriaceae bacterium]|nr:DUF2520 domain-containing protein [Flavobacteriaceae bacterium]
MTTLNLIGAGNLGHHLARAIDKADDIRLSYWYNRDKKSISEPNHAIMVTDQLADLEAADITIVTVSDDAVGALSSQIPYENTLVVHTSGSVGIHDLDSKHKRGVFYPLQTFSKEVIMDFQDVPLCLEALEKSDLNQLKQLAEALGSKHYRINTEQRQILHLAAVFVNNFSNQLYRIGHEITDVKNINFDILKPLILETAKKVQDVSPYMAQTGPAKRDDQKTIRRHLKLLDNPLHKDIYELLTQSIQQTHGRKKL